MSHATIRDLIHDYVANADTPTSTSCATAKYTLDTTLLRAFRLARSNADAIRARGTNRRNARSKRR